MPRVADWPRPTPEPSRVGRTEAESETRFFNRDINIVVEFVRDDAGNVAELVVHQGTHQERATRTK